MARTEGPELIAGQVAFSAPGDGSVLVRVGGVHYVVPAGDVADVAAFFGAQVPPDQTAHVPDAGEGAE